MEWCQMSQQRARSFRRSSYAGLCSQRCEERVAGRAWVWPRWWVHLWVEVQVVNDGPPHVTHLLRHILLENTSESPQQSSSAGAKERGRCKEGCLGKLVTCGEMRRGGDARAARKSRPYTTL